MKLINIASNDSVWRGLDYYKLKKIKNYKMINKYEYQCVANGSNNNKYDVYLNIEHPRKSTCNCPHANGKRVICKHIVALYFTIFPNEVDNFLKEVEQAQQEYEEYEKEQEKKLNNYIKSMSKSDLQETVLELLNEVPDWVYDRFIRDRIGY